MRLEFTLQEAELLDSLLEAVLRERLHQVHHSDSREFRKRLEREVELIESMRARLAEASRAT